MKFRIITTYIITVFFINCAKNDKKKLNLDQDKIVSNCIEYLIDNKKIEECYLVNPYIDDFSFDDFSKQTKDSILGKFYENYQEYENLQNRTNKDYKNAYIKNLLEFSTCERSHFILSFSGLSNNIIIAQLNDNYESLDFSQLNDNFKTNSSQTDFYIFILNEEGKVIEVLKDTIYYD